MFHCQKLLSGIYRRTWFNGNQHNDPFSSCRPILRPRLDQTNVYNRQNLDILYSSKHCPRKFLAVSMKAEIVLFTVIGKWLCLWLLLRSDGYNLGLRKKWNNCWDLLVHLVPKFKEIDWCNLHWSLFYSLNMRPIFFSLNLDLMHTVVFFLTCYLPFFEYNFSFRNLSCWW